MSVNFIFVCPEKRQHFSPLAFFERDTDRYQLGRETGQPSYHALALSLLTCEVGAKDHHFDESHLPWAAWLGSAAYAVSDSDLADMHGIRTATEDDPRQNLYNSALDSYEDISIDAALMVCCWEERAAPTLIERVRIDLEWSAAHSVSALHVREASLIDAGRIANRDMDLRGGKSGCFERELAQVFGEEWRKRYEAAEADLDAWNARFPDAKPELLARYY